MNRTGDNLEHTHSNKEIVEAFSRFGVDFLVVGGLAVSWYCPERQAEDMDLLVDPSPENATRVSQALSSLSSLPLGGIAPDSFSKLGVQLSLKRFYYADILTPAPDGPPFRHIAANCVAGKLFGFPVCIPSLLNLVRLKETAAVAAIRESQKHGKDIQLLKAHNAV